MKFLRRTFILLFLINGLLLYMHYNEAGNATTGSGAKSAFQQEIEVMNRSDGLHIRHHFKNLSDRRHEIIWPEMSINRACYMESSVACSRLDEDVTAFTEGEEKKQSISYVIPRSGPMENTLLFNNIFAGIHNSIASSTYFHLTDEIGVGGQWVNGLKLAGHEKMGLIDYSFYRGLGEVKDLYWQKTEAPLLFESDKLSIYGFNAEVNLEEYEDASKVFKELGIPHHTVVMNSGNDAVRSSRFIIQELAKGEKVTDKILINNIRKQFLIEPDDQLTAEFLATLLSGKAIGSSRTNELYEEVLNTLTEPEMKEFTEQLMDNKENLTDAAFLDEVIMDVTGFQTSFFENNDHVNNPTYPFLFEEPRTVYINGNESLLTKILLKDGKVLYPGIQIMRELGFNMTQNDRSLYLENATKKYRFPFQEPFYVFNERKYNVMSIPFERIADEYYFEEVSLIRIFLLDIKKSTEKIEITPISIVAEEE